MNGWDSVPLNQLCVRANRYEVPEAGTSYRQMGIRLWGAGAYERDQVDGGETQYSKLNRVASNDLVVNKIWARNGSVAVVTPSLSGTYVSGEFPAFTMDSSRLLPEWMRLITKWQGFWRSCDEKARGTSGKNRIKPKQFLSVEIPLPPLAEQQAIAARLDALADKTRQLTAHLDAIEAAADQLLAQRFQQAIADAPYRPMGQLAPLVRRQVDINFEASYPELGVRSFGKGTFHKPALSGADAGTKRLFRIEPGDLVFSNVFAWEGAIAIAGADDNDRYGSHRFMTCVANTKVAVAEFILYYLLSPEGMEKVRDASPGGAGRNRTLGVQKLEKLTIPVPSLSTQRAFVALQAKVNDLKARHARVHAANADLLPATLERLFGEPACSTE